MKKIFLFIFFLVVVSFAHSQILKKLGDRVKQKAEQKAAEKVDKTIDDGTKGNKDEKKNTDENNTESTGTTNSSQPATIKTYSKYDFVPGEKIIVFEDFMQDAIGDLPAKWNTDGACETVTIEGQAGQWMKMTQKGVFRPDFIDSIPPDCTLEFDLMVDKPSGSWGILPVLAELPNLDKPQDWRDSKNMFYLTLLTPGENGVEMSDYYKKKNGDFEHTPFVSISAFSDLTKPVHVAMWRQKERLRIYLNEQKTWDVPKAIDPQAKLNSFILVIEAKGDWNYYMSNLRLAVGAPDTRKKILEQNKWVTHGILFDVNKATIKPESYGTLKEMASVLKEYPDLKVKIVGHTDADGKDDANLDLSKRRAAAVKDMLAKEFGIDESRMETDGKGESEPIDNNTTPAGKANNRRVEFIKI
jgi:OOP family OmpA-OmpF porin